MVSPASRPTIQTAALILSVALAAVLAGCGGSESLSPDKIALDEHASGDNQCGLHSQVLRDPIRVMVFGPQQPGLLGGKGGRRPIPGVDVTFTVENPECGTVFEESQSPSLTVATDKGGAASAEVHLGNRSGDVNISASFDDEGNTKSVDLRLVSGMELIGADLEGPTEGTIPEFGLRLQDPDGTPVAGVPVYFRIEGDGQKSAVGGKELLKILTDEEGQALTSWKLGKKVQQYFVSAEVVDRRTGIPEDYRYQGRAIEFVAMAVDKKAMAVQLLGGLAVFILGMKWMSNGLRRMADRRLKAILQAMTRNRFMSAGVGAGLTALVQSSSATTVMTVGFVNAGLITLTQAIGVVYGANIGTTITAQIIAFKLNELAYPAIALGLIMSALAKRAWMKSLGEAILGFGLLFLGMTTMSSILKPLQHSPEFQSLFQLFDCSPVDGGGVRALPALMCILMGTVATVVIQSSSATVGLVLALSGQGLLGFYTAVPLVLGDNIGTTITAVFASLGANRNAKRAACAHAMFNVLGAAYMYILLFVPLWNGQPLFLGFIDWITPGDVFASSSENLVRHVANAHTSFNVMNCVLFLPFVGTMAKICKRIIPLTEADEEQVLEYLEPRLLEAPTIAIEQAIKEVAYMVRRAQKSINEGCAFFHNGARDLENKIQAREDLIDRLQSEITAYLVELSRKDLTPEEATLIPALIHAVNDAERIGDHSENLLELTYLKREGKYTFSEDAVADLTELEDLLGQQFEATISSLIDGDPSQVDRVLKTEDAITELMARAADAHVKRLEHDRCSVQAGVIFLDLLAHLERVGDHLVNIAERAGRIIQITSE
ncbi:MAG: hypothetical protein GY851_34125 [bacterium]|nr:hypothetical protein [bacterium]